MLFLFSIWSEGCGNLYGTRGTSLSIMESKEKGVFISDQFEVNTMFIPDSFGIKINEVFFERGWGHPNFSKKVLSDWAGPPDERFQLIITLDPNESLIENYYFNWYVEEVSYSGSSFDYFTDSISLPDTMHFHIITGEDLHTTKRNLDTVGEILVTKKILSQ